MSMTNHRTADLDSYTVLTTDELRGKFLIEELFVDGQITLVYTDLDRAIVGAAVPSNGPLELSAGDELRADFFCQRREVGVINIGEAGTITVDGTTYEVGNRECLYIGRGSERIRFDGAGAQYYLLSYPAHADYPTTHAGIEDANRLELGSKADANERHLYQYIHENGIRSCQLVMGFTVLQPGSVWNTMPPHTHDRRSEVYVYFDIASGHQVAHFMGEPDETRVLWISEKQVALSPSWSVHCGSGTGAYAFIWGMGGENQRFDDMDGFPITDLR